MAARPTLSVVLVNHNGAACLGRSLAALAQHTAEESVECIVVDSGSGDDSWQAVERHWTAARALRFEANIGFYAVMWDRDATKAPLAEQEAQWALMARSGVESVRTVFSWALAQPEPLVTSDTTRSV